VVRLTEICDEGRAAAEADDLARAVAANDAFHAEIAVIAGNAVLAELAGIVGRRVQWYYRMVAPARGHTSWAEHRELIAAIEASDAERAQRLARTHTERTRTAYHRVLLTLALSSLPVPVLAVARNRPLARARARTRNRCWITLPGPKGA
jgi:DNA-binding GntR family transcriptional regulator